MKKKTNRLFRLLSVLYFKLTKINDTPQRKALGFGLGVFLGVLPATGPIASLVVASFLRLNRATALLGSLLTNTWLSIVIFALSVKVGSVIMQVDWQKSSRDWVQFFQQFSFASLFKLSFFKMALPVLLGYFLVSFSIGVIVYLVALAVILYTKNR